MVRKSVSEPGFEMTFLTLWVYKHKKRLWRRSYSHGVTVLSRRVQPTSCSVQWNAMSNNDPVSLCLESISKARGCGESLNIVDSCSGQAPESCSSRFLKNHVIVTCLRRVRQKKLPSTEKQRCAFEYAKKKRRRISQTLNSHMDPLVICIFLCSQFKQQLMRNMFYVHKFWQEKNKWKRYKVWEW